MPVDDLYSPERTRVDYTKIQDPGVFPFTRGNFSGGYRDKPWTIRQYSGFGSAEGSNARYKLLLKEGGTGLSVAADLPTQIGYDSDHPDVVDDVGRVGVALDTLADAQALFDGIPLDRVSTSWTVNGTAAIMLAFYAAVGRAQGVASDQLRGTIQNDILKEYVARGTWIWPPEPSVRLIADCIEFCAEHMPRYNAISVAGAHFRDAGATAAQEMAFTLADAVVYVDAVLDRGRMTIDQFAPQISFFFYTHNDFFEEVAKYRAGRRRWARIVRERYHATQDSSCMFRVGCVAGGSTLQAPQAQNNIVRVAYQALSSVLGGVQSMFTAAWDEPFALPTEESALLALRTQQILAHETGVTRTVDPLGGSWFIESLTDAMEERIVSIMDDVDQRGGMIRAIEDGYVQSLIADEAWRIQRAVDSGVRPVVGVNAFATDEPPPDVESYGFDQSQLQIQLDRLAAIKQERDGRAVVRALADLQVGAKKGNQNLIPRLIDAVERHCTVGEMVGALTEVWGEYRQPVVY